MSRNKSKHKDLAGVDSGPKILYGAELAEYLGQRQAGQVRRIKQMRGRAPVLAIINANLENKVIQTYIRLKSNRAAELGIVVEVFEIVQQEAAELIKKLNSNKEVDGIILQLPLEEPQQTDQLINLIAKEKDVDGLGEKALLEPATAKAIIWLLAGNNLEIAGKKILIIGQGRLVGAPLTRIWQKDGLEIKTADEKTGGQELLKLVAGAELIVSAAGAPKLLKAEMLRPKQIIIDAGLAESEGKLIGDLDPSIYQNLELGLTLSAQKGGLGPLTISCLFENLLLLIDKVERL